MKPNGEMSFTVVIRDGNGVVRELSEAESGLYLFNQASDTSWGFNRLATEQMWKRTKGEGVRVAVIDSGIDITHPLLKGCLKGGIDLRTIATDFGGLPERDWIKGENAYNYFDKNYTQWLKKYADIQHAKGKNSGFYLPYNGDYYVKKFNSANKKISNPKSWGSNLQLHHGTHVAGIIAGKTLKNNSGKIKFSGISPNVELYFIRWRMKGEGKLDSLSLFEQIQLYSATASWCIANKINVVNCSFGQDEDNGYADEHFYSKLIKAGIVVVCGAGNENEVINNSKSKNDRVIYPAKYSGTIAVAATDNLNQVASFSSRGPEVDFAAPGYLIWSTIPVNRGSYRDISGTSMAAPHITGAVALIMSAYKKRTGKFPDLKYIYNELKKGCVDLGKPGKDIQTGWGLFTFNKFKAEKDNQTQSSTITKPTNSIKSMNLVPSLVFDKNLQVKLTWSIPTRNTDNKKYVGDFDNIGIYFKINSGGWRKFESESWGTGNRTYDIYVEDQAPWLSFAGRWAAPDYLLSNKKPAVVEAKVVYTLNKKKEKYYKEYGVFKNKNDWIIVSNISKFKLDIFDFVWRLTIL